MKARSPSSSIRIKHFDGERPAAGEERSGHSLKPALLVDFEAHRQECLCHRLVPDGDEAKQEIPWRHGRAEWSVGRVVAELWRLGTKRNAKRGRAGAAARKVAKE